MKALSEQLADLSKRVKQTEDSVALTREKNRQKLEAQRTKLNRAIDDGNAKAEDVAKGTRGKVQARWNETRSSVNQWFASMRSEADERRAERDIKKAQHNAEVAEEDAADAIDLALYVIDQAEYAVVDATLARADADELALTT
ncbi:MAG: hypothetical protein JWL83_2772 [Actinomycetia bacterium]|nr:hypothetical protein [Actinomycetes bacterium]